MTVLHLEGFDGECVAGDAEVTDPVTGRVTCLRDVVRQPAIAGVHTLDSHLAIGTALIGAKASGRVQPVARITLASGRCLTATARRLLLTPDGWQAAAVIERGTTVALAGRVPAPLLPVPLPDAEIDLLAVLLAEGCYTQRWVTFTTASPEILDLATRAAAGLGMTVRQAWKYDYRLNGTGPDPSAAARGRGTCWCGCGKPTRPARSTARRLGHQAGVPQRYAYGCKPRSLARQLLDRHGIGHQSAHGKKIPPRMFQVPDWQLARFLAVFWMCDGYVDRSPGLTLASQQMVRDIQYLLLRFGIQSTVAPINRGRHWRLRVPSRWWQPFRDTIPIWGYKAARLDTLIKTNSGTGSVIGLPTFTPGLRRSLRAASDPDGLGARVPPRTYMARNARTGQGKAADVAARLGWTKFQFDRLSNRGTNTICAAAFKAYCQVFQVTRHDWIWSPDIFWDRIVSVTPVGDQEVYDLQAGQDGHFIASCVITSSGPAGGGVPAGGEAEGPCPGVKGRGPVRFSVCLPWETNNS